MEQKKKLKLKDKIIIYMKKTKPMKWQICFGLSIILLSLLFVMGMNYETKRAKAPAALTTSKVQLRVTFTGDVQISDNIRKLAQNTGYSGLFRGVSGYWSKSDYVVANISGPVLTYDVSHYTSTRDKNEISNYLRPRAIRGMSDAGINLFSFANDDAYNYGRTGIKSTLNVMDEYDTEYLGIGSDSKDSIYKVLEYTFKDTSGKSEKRKIAVMSVNDVVRKHSTVGEGKEGLINSSMVEVYESLYQASEECDYVIAYVHLENGTASEQKKTAQAMIDAGADVVVGNSNILQNIEKYSDGIIAYGLGNFITDETSTYSKDAALLDFVVRNSGEAVLYLTPIRVEEGRPEVTTEQLYIRRIQQILVKNLPEDCYKITEDGLVRISLGQLPELEKSEVGDENIWQDENQ